MSPFTEKDKRVTADLATKRNRSVATISDEILIPYAAPGSKTETLALELLASGKRILTFDSRPGPLRRANVLCDDSECLELLGQWATERSQFLRIEADELVEFVSAVDEIRVVDDFAKNEGVFLWRPYYAD